MNYFHTEKYLYQGQIVKAYCSHRANFMLLDTSSYNNFRTGKRFSYYGGFFKTTNLEITVPHTGHWHIVLDFSMHKGTIKYSPSIQIIDP